VDASSEINVIPAMLEQVEQIGGEAPRQAMFDANHANRVEE